MCQAGLAVEQIGESKQGNENLNHVTLRARTQEDNCTCLVFIENQSLSGFLMYIEPYGALQSSAPKEFECGLELYLDFYQEETLQPDRNFVPIKCASGQLSRSLTFLRNSVLSFTSKVSSGNFTRGYCIDIQRVHVNGENGTLKIVCGIPGVIPSTRYTTPQSLDLFTKSPVNDHSTLSGSPMNDDSTVYIASGASAGVVVIAAFAIAIIVCKRHRNKRKQPVPIINVNMQYDSLSEAGNASNYSTLNNTQADDQQYEIVEIH
ncbi:unnamed protein product [Mytilus coruscus]|uniref:Uncharacterized protein n=1 Tax=Mytilus coruscus TaxID=42192 RepID=A0A6J8AEQ3_MYTCO|nr:unnamed protein product [Mytilus coruscus]